MDKHTLRALKENVRQAYLRLLVDRIEVDDDQVRMFGHKDTLKGAVHGGADRLDALVPSFVREWRPQRDSNACYRSEKGCNGSSVKGVACPRNYAVLRLHPPIYANALRRLRARPRRSGRGPNLRILDVHRLQRVMPTYD